LKKRTSRLKRGLQNKKILKKREPKIPKRTPKNNLCFQKHKVLGEKINSHSKRDRGLKNRSKEVALLAICMHKLLKNFHR
jgi:hypothetical protein